MLIFTSWFWMNCSWPSLSSQPFFGLCIILCVPLFKCYVLQLHECVTYHIMVSQFLYAKLYWIHLVSPAISLWKCVLLLCCCPMTLAFGVDQTLWGEDTQQGSLFHVFWNCVGQQCLGRLQLLLGWNTGFVGSLMWLVILWSFSHSP